MSRVFLHTTDSTREIAPADLPTAVAEGQFIWMHLSRDDDIRGIMAQLSDIPDMALNAFMASETRPRCTLFGDGALINLRGMGEQLLGDNDPLVSIRLWAQTGRIFTLSYRRLGIFDDVVGLMYAGQLHDPGDVISALAVAITEALDPDVAELNDGLDNIESHIDEHGAISTRTKVSKIRATAIAYRRFLSPQRQAMERLMTAPASWIEPDDRLHLQEAADRCARMVEELEAVRERAALAHEGLTDLRAEHMNRQGLILAVVALIFLPLTFFTGLLGMNVEGIPFAREPWAFWGVVAFCTTLAMAMGGWFVVTRWLQD